VRIVFLAMFVLASSALPAANAQPDPKPNPRFGAINAYEAPDAAAELSIGWEQITFNWSAFQPHGPAEFITDSIDPAWLDSAARAGREVVGLIASTPAWASESGERSAVPEGLGLPSSDPGNVWATFVRRLVETYAARGVHRWIIYDEPDVPRGEGRVQFAGSVEDYAHLLRAAYQAATAADPRAQIHIAAMSWWADVAAGREPYLARLLRVLSASAGGDYFDVMMVRVLDSTQAIWDITTQTRAILDAAGLVDKPIWLVTNATPTRDPRDPQVSASDALFGITPEQQADFVVQAAAISFALGMERVGIERLVDPPAPPHAQGIIGAAIDWLVAGREQPPAWGLIRADGSRRPAFEAYQTVIRLFTPATAAQSYSHAAADLITLEQGDKDVYVLWARGTTPVSFVITSGAVGESAVLYNAHGQPLPVSSEAVEWPAAFTIEAPPAQLDANGFLTVAGAPRILVFDHSDFYRVVYLDTPYERSRLR
jgi:hypothetical protein